jgi:hypothetical protein
VAAIIYKLEETGYLSKYNLRVFFIRISSDSEFKQEIEPLIIEKIQHFTHKCNLVVQKECSNAVENNLNEHEDV